MVSSWAGRRSMSSVPVLKVQGGCFSRRTVTPTIARRDLQKPDVTAADKVTTDVLNLETFGGTSAAAPQVAGIAALLKSKDPSLTAEEIKSALRGSAIQIEGPAEWNPLSGYGIVNAMRALRAIETVKGHKASSRICANDDRRPRSVEQPLRSSMAMRRSSQAGALESGARNVHGGCSRVEREARRHCARRQGMDQDREDKPALKLI